MRNSEAAKRESSVVKRNKETKPNFAREEKNGWGTIWKDTWRENDPNWKGICVCHREGLFLVHSECFFYFPTVHVEW